MDHQNDNDLLNPPPAKRDLLYSGFINPVLCDIWYSDALFITDCFDEEAQCARDGNRLGFLLYRQAQRGVDHLSRQAQCAKDVGLSWLKGGSAKHAESTSNNGEED